MNLLKVLLVCREGLLVLRGQSVVTHVLLLARIAGCVEGVGHAVLRRHSSPNGFSVLVGIVVNRQAAFIELLAVLENILADFTKVDVEVAAQVLTSLACLHERVHHPELNVFDIGGLEIGHIKFAHHTAPTLAGIAKVAVGIQRRVKIVRATLVGIVRQVEHVERGGFFEVDTLIGEQLILIHLAHIGVGQLCQVAFDIARGERRRTAGEERVNVVPCQERTVVAITYIARQSRFGELAGHA